MYKVDIDGHLVMLYSFPAWEVVVTRQQGQEDVKMLSRITATFSVGQCVKSEGSTGCQITDTHTMHVVGIT